MANTRLPIVLHLPPEEIARRYRACRSGVEKTHWQVLWLLTRPDQPLSPAQAAQQVGLTPVWCPRPAQALERRRAGRPGRPPRRRQRRPEQAHRRAAHRPLGRPPHARRVRAWEREAGHTDIHGELAYVRLSLHGFKGDQVRRPAGRSTTTGRSGRPATGRSIRSPTPSVYARGPGQRVRHRAVDGAGPRPGPVLRALRSAHAGRPAARPRPEPPVPRRLVRGG